MSLKVLLLTGVFLTLSGCSKPDIKPMTIKNYSGNFSESQKYYGVQSTWEF